MNENAPGILILGGGMAGMAAARSLSHQPLSVHLVEEQDHLGGNAALWACMATDACQNCGACLSQEMAGQVAGQDNVTLYLKTKIKGLTRTDQGFDALLTSGKTISAAKVIMATGFAPFDPDSLPSLHSATCKNVITTVQLNALFRQEGLGDFLGKAHPPRVAFIQCVGSRNRELKKEYCSQVCCKISMRHARKLIHEIPDARITLFYMDLQIIGKEIRQKFHSLAQQIELVQGVPAEILENPDSGTLTMVIEDAATQSRLKREFDLVVLSVGLSAAADLSETAALLEAVPNDWGFFNTRDAGISNDIYIAGCAAGPKDILSSKQDGSIAGAKVLEDLGLAGKPGMNVAILGHGPQAAMVAQAVAAKGYPAYAFGSGADATIARGTHPLPHARLLAVDGTMGNFSIYYEDQGKKKTLTCGAIIAAEEPAAIPIGTGDFQTAMDLNQFERIPSRDVPERTLILLDYFGPEFKASARLALLVAMAAREAGKQITIAMQKMLVHTALGQVLYDQARKAGVRFLRFNRAADIRIQAQKKGFHILLREATLPNLELALECDCLVVPDTIRAGTEFKTLGKLLHLPLDREGFLQPANVRHRLVRSQRNGIFFAGTCHDEVDEDDLGCEIQEILSGLSFPGLPSGKTGVMVNEKKCAKCLTCFRICPHGAIVLNEKMRPQIMENACFSCHLCVSNCPAYAIESTEFTNDQIAGRVADWGTKGQVVVFACERSAALAAGNDNLPETTQMITLPCACRISPDMILKSLVNGASKIIISPCHQGNCRSVDGSATARAAVDAIAKMPGVLPGKIAWEPVAANETIKFHRIIAKA